jgi:hypothetical protein
VSLRFDPPRLGEETEEYVLFYSNDPVRPVLKFRLTGSVGTAIRLSPEGIAVGISFRPELAKMTFNNVQLIPLDGKPIGKIRLEASHPSIRPEVQHQDKDSYFVAVTVDETIPMGVVDQRVRVYTEHPTVPVIDIPILGKVLGDLDPDGRRIDFGLIKEGRPASVTFRLRNRHSGPLKVLKAEAKMPVPARVEAKPDETGIEIVVRIDPQPAFTSLRGTVELTTDHPTPDERVAVVEVYGGVLSAAPFEQIARDGSDVRFIENVIMDALARGEHIEEKDFFDQILGGARDDRAAKVLLNAYSRAGRVRLAERMRAVELLGTLKTPEVLETLRKAITDDLHEFVRRLALVAYANAVGQAAMPELLLALQDDESWVQEDAAGFIAKYGDSSAVPALLAALNDADEEAAQAIRSALAAVRGRAAK